MEIKDTFFCNEAHYSVLAGITLAVIILLAILPGLRATEPFNLVYLKLTTHGVLCLITIGTSLEVGRFIIKIRKTKK